MHLSVEEMALTSPAQIRKLEVILEELDKRLGLQDSSRIKWNVKRESCSQLGFSNKATSRQMFCSSGNNFEVQQDLVQAPKGSMIATLTVRDFSADKIY